MAFAPKWAIALAQIDALLADGLPRAPVVTDAGYGVATAFREGVLARGLSYAVGISADTTLWPPGQGPLLPRAWSGLGRPPTRYRRTPRHSPVSAKALAESLAARVWKTVRWREGTKGAMQSRFARLRVRAAHRDARSAAPRMPEWLLVEWPRGESEPTRYWLSSVPETVSIEDLVRLAKLRWRIERDYQELEDELGLDHYEGRGWRGFHHHGVLCIAAYAFLVAERARLSPQHLLPSCAPLAYPRASALAAPPVRPERHHPASITTLRVRQARWITARLPCCPSCGIMRL